MRLLYGCEYCGNIMSSEKDVVSTHEVQCKLEHDLIKVRDQHLLSYVKNFESTFTFENILQCVNDYVGPMYGDHFTEIRIVNHKFRNKVGKEAKVSGYNHPVFGYGEPGFTGQIYGKKSKKWKTLADYPELGFILDGPMISEKGWNSAFRLFAVNLEQFSDLVALAYLKEKV